MRRTDAERRDDQTIHPAAILTLLAFGRKISYICIRKGAGRRDRPLYIVVFQAAEGRKATVRAKNASNGSGKCTTCILKKVTSILKYITCIPEKPAAKCCGRLNTLKSGGGICEKQIRPQTVRLFEWPTSTKHSIICEYHR